MPETIVIAGAGHAAGQTAVSLRQGGFSGRLIIVGEERYPPYQRPPLSKKFLAGELEVERLYLRPSSFYADHDIELRLETRVASILRDDHEVQCEDGIRQPYDKLVLATGSRVRAVPIPGSDLDGVGYLRNVADVKSIQQRFQPGARLTIVGAGYIGLEVAAVAASAGLEVTVREIAERVMARVVSPEISKFYLRAHREAGVQFQLGTSGKLRIDGNGAVSAVIDGDGEPQPADLVVIGVGVLPNAELAQEAGLICNDGIVVDEYCQTSDADILAVGDCTRHPNTLLGEELRLESVHNAQEQAKTAARTLLGDPQPYSQVPWFWSDQYDLKLQIAGICKPDNQRIVRGDPAERSFAVLSMNGERLTAVESVNSPREFMLGKKLIAAGASLDAEALADPGTDFKALANAALQA